MKRTERHHLKENELRNFAASAREAMESRGKQVTWIALAAAIVIVLGGGYYAWRQRVEARAGALLAEAMIVEDARVGPAPADGAPAGGLSFETARAKHQAALTKYKVVADEYPSTAAGLFARYREGATRMALGMPNEAAQAYQQVIDKAGNRFYGLMAKLGLAEARARAGQYDQAITLYNELSQRKDDVAVDGVLMQLGRTYRDAGKRAEAEQSFNRVISEFPGSPFNEEAHRELDSLKKS